MVGIIRHGFFSCILRWALRARISSIIFFKESIVVTKPSLSMCFLISYSFLYRFSRSNIISISLTAFSLAWFTWEATLRSTFLVLGIWNGRTGPWEGASKTTSFFSPFFYLSKRSIYWITSYRLYPIFIIFLPSLSFSFLELLFPKRSIWSEDSPSAAADFGTCGGV